MAAVAQAAAKESNGDIVKDGDNVNALAGQELCFPGSDFDLPPASQRVRQIFGEGLWAISDEVSAGHAEHAIEMQVATAGLSRMCSTVTAHGVISHMRHRVAVMRRAHIAETLCAAQIASTQVLHRYARESLV